MSKPGPGHNSAANAEKALRGLASRIEQLDEEISGLNAEKSDAYKEAKRLGFPPDALRGALKYRKDPEKADEKTAEMERVLEVLGRAQGDGTPRATRVHARGGGGDE
ncbi:GapR family DNA-binding domain-containing protein [Elioraea sp.]|uniref:GapR family DNA-binding domain-containing protein n=1 Tax=Elioraea sp. TaxID=2185103 RepID=UPI0025B90B43|nr:GapR family DNA-binding domain-containing protein [Elioraea sp.]